MWIHHFSNWLESFGSQLFTRFPSHTNLQCSNKRVRTVPGKVKVPGRGGRSQPLGEPPAGKAHIRQLRLHFLPAQKHFKSRNWPVCVPSDDLLQKAILDRKRAHCVDTFTRTVRPHETAHAQFLSQDSLGCILRASDKLGDHLRLDSLPPNQGSSSNQAEGTHVSSPSVLASPPRAPLDPASSESLSYDSVPTINTDWAATHMLQQRNTAGTRVPLPARPYWAAREGKK